MLIAGFAEVLSHANTPTARTVLLQTARDLRALAATKISAPSGDAESDLEPACCLAGRWEPVVAFAERLLEELPAVESEAAARDAQRMRGRGRRRSPSRGVHRARRSTAQRLP